MPRRTRCQWMLLTLAFLSVTGVCRSQPQAPATAPQTTAAPAVAPEVLAALEKTLPPACSVVVGGITYQQCGGTWYQPQYAGTQVTYVVVNPPR